MTTLRRPPALAKYCISCGASLPGRARFCTRCGHAVERGVSRRSKAGLAARFHIPRVLLLFGGVVVVVALAAATALVLRGGGEERAIGPNIPAPPVVTPDPEMVAVLQPILDRLPEPAGDTDRDQVRSLLGPPDSFEISFELADGGRSDRLIRYEIWYYFELLSAFEFADGELIANMPVDDVQPLAILPRQYDPDMFRPGMMLDDVKKLLAIPDALVSVAAPPELEVDVTCYYGEQLMVALDGAGVFLVRTYPLEAGGGEE